MEFIITLMLAPAYVLLRITDWLTKGDVKAMSGPMAWLISIAAWVSLGFYIAGRIP